MIKDLNQRGTVSDKPMHILNLTIKDNAEEAEKGARECLEFCKRVSLYLISNFSIVDCK